MMMVVQDGGRCGFTWKCSSNFTSKFLTLQNLKTSLFELIDSIQTVRRNLQYRREFQEEITVPAQNKVSALESYSDILKNKPKKIKTKHKILIKIRNYTIKTEIIFKKEINPKELKIGLTILINAKRSYCRNRSLAVFPMNNDGYIIIIIKIHEKPMMDK